MQSTPPASKTNEDSKDHDITGQRRDSFVTILTGRRAYGFMAIAVTILFALHYYILEPSNFASFSDTLRYFISALSTLLAVVVSFNTLALRNQLNNMPTSIETLNSQLEKAADLLQTALGKEHVRLTGNEKPALYYTDAVETMLRATKGEAESLVKQESSGGQLQQICLDFIQQASHKLAMYSKHKSSFFLISISTTGFLQRMKFASPDLDGRQEKLFETAKRLHIVRNIGVRIFIRNALTKLSFDLLVFTIPIIAFAALISAISNYGSYNTMLLRLLFAASMSTVILPFILLFIRTMPVLQLIKGTPSIPFEEKQ